MKTPRSVTLASLFVLSLIVLGCTQPPMRPGWVTLIDGGQGLANFTRVGDANWRAENGAIVADKGTGNSYLLTRNSYSDFELTVEFWADHTTNSGIHMRVQEPANVTDRNSYEANIFDRRPDLNYGTGALVNFARVIGSPRAGGQWNTYEITAKGGHIVLVLNGVRTAELTGAVFARGPIALQYNANPGGAIKWRKLKIKPL
jgi:hypothetical protein